RPRQVPAGAASLRRRGHARAVRRVPDPARLRPPVLNHPDGPRPWRPGCARARQKGARPMYLYESPTPEQLEKHWQTLPRWAGVRRDYRGADVVRLRGSVHVEHTLARRGAGKLWRLLHEEPYVHALGTLT